MKYIITYFEDGHYYYQKVKSSEVKLLKNQGYAVSQINDDELILFNSIMNLYNNLQKTLGHLDNQALEEIEE